MSEQSFTPVSALAHLKVDRSFAYTFINTLHKGLDTQSFSSYTALIDD
jgi:hypothetical protein